MAIILFFSAFFLLLGVVGLYYKTIIQQNKFISYIYILGCILSLAAGWLFPPKIEVISDSYLIGFNNKMALFFLILTIGITFYLFVLKYKMSSTDLFFKNPDNFTNSFNKKKTTIVLYTFVLFSIIIQICWFFGLDKNIEIARIVDNWNYIPKLYQMDKGLIPYKDFEFTYGFLMLFIPFLFIKFFNFTPEISYIFFLIIGTTIGIYSLFIILIKYLRVKKIIFWAVFINSTILINSLLYTAIHYTFFRFLTPLLLVFLLIEFNFKYIYIKDYFKLFLFTFITYCIFLFNFGISPEIGITTCLAYILTILFFLKGRKNYFHILYLFLFFIFSILILKIYNPQLLKNIFIHFIQVSSGAWNLPWYVGLIMIGFFYILFLDIQFFSFILIKKEKKNIYIFCSFIFSFLNLPSALGRADFVHIFFNGIAFFIISVMFINYLKNKFVINFIKITLLLYFCSFILVLNNFALPLHRYNLRKNIIDNFNLKLKKNHNSLINSLQINSIFYLKSLNKKVLVAGYIDQSLFKIYKENDFLQIPYFANMIPKTNMNIQKQLNEINKYEYLILLKKNFDSLNNNSLVDNGLFGSDLLFFIFLSPCFENKIFNPTKNYNLNHKISDYIQSNYVKVTSFKDSNYYLLKTKTPYVQ